MRLLYAERILPVDATIAEAWGRISGERSRPVVDSLLVATAMVLGMTLVTRNLRDMRDTGVELFSPWDAA